YGGGGCGLVLALHALVYAEYLVTALRDHTCPARWAAVQDRGVALEALDDDVRAHVVIRRRVRVGDRVAVGVVEDRGVGHGDAMALAGGDAGLDVDPPLGGGRQDDRRLLALVQHLGRSARPGARLGRARRAAGEEHH